MKTQTSRLIFGLPLTAVLATFGCAGEPPPKADAPAAKLAPAEEAAPAEAAASPAETPGEELGKDGAVPSEDTARKPAEKGGD